MTPDTATTTADPVRRDADAATDGTAPEGQDGTAGDERGGITTGDGSDGDPPSNATGAEDAPPGTDDRFPRPPDECTDEEGREIAFRTVDEDDFDPLAAMYDGFGRAERAQGIPPVDDRRRREWLADLLSDGLNVAAWHGDRAVGHATLVPMDGTTAELAIFVAGEYQQAGIGSRLLRLLLGHGRANGVDRVWLTVQRSNRIAMNLYRSVGFEQLARGQECEMELDL